MVKTETRVLQVEITTTNNTYHCGKKITLPFFKIKKLLDKGNSIAVIDFCKVFSLCLITVSALIKKPKIS